MIEPLARIENLNDSGDSFAHLIVPMIRCHDRGVNAPIPIRGEGVNRVC